MPNESIAIADFLQWSRAGNYFSAVEQLQSEFSDDSSSNAGLFHPLMLDAYWKLKDLPTAVALATAGIHYCITQARCAAEPAQMNELRSKAKAMAYDLGSFTWPGWDEPGIAPTPEQIALGLEAAKFNLQLALQLHKRSDRVRSAHWLLGAQLLANRGEGQLQQALHHLLQAIPPETDEDFAMFRGYLILGRRMLGEPAATAEWDSIISLLGGRQDETAISALAQLTAASRVLLPSTTQANS